MFLNRKNVSINKIKNGNRVIHDVFTYRSILNKLLEEEDEEIRLERHTLKQYPLVCVKLTVCLPHKALNLGEVCLRKPTSLFQKLKKISPDSQISMDYVSLPIK